MLGQHIVYVGPVRECSYTLVLSSNGIPLDLKQPTVCICWLCRDRRTGIIFLIVNYNHIAVTLRAADAGVTHAGAGTAGGSAVGGAAAAAAAGGSQSSTGGAHSAHGGSGIAAALAAAGAAAGIGDTGATALRECEVRSAESALLLLLTNILLTNLLVVFERTQKLLVHYQAFGLSILCFA